MNIEIGYLNKRLKNEVDVLKTLKLCKTLNELNIPSLMGEEINNSEFSSINTISKLSEIEQEKVEFAISKLIEKKYVDVKNRGFKINTDGLAYLEFKDFKTDQLMFIINNPMRRLDNWMKILSFVAAFIALIASFRNCNRVNELEDSNSSITISNATKANKQIAHINKYPTNTAIFSIIE